MEDSDLMAVLRYARVMTLAALLGFVLVISFAGPPGWVRFIEGLLFFGIGLFHAALWGMVSSLPRLVRLPMPESRPPTLLYPSGFLAGRKGTRPPVQ